MTSIINKSKENAIINETVKDGTLTIEVCSNKNKTVRPIMTVEARDAIDNMHSMMGREGRSESIIRFCNQFIMNEVARDYYYKESSKWKLIAWSMAAACVALVATMMLTAS